MKFTGRYCSVTEFDLDHEINSECERMEKILSNINALGNSYAIPIKKALIETILNDL